MRLIDANELPKVKFHPLPYTHVVPADLIGEMSHAYERGWNDAIDAIVENAEAVDAVPVVRCKDCDRHNGNYCHHPNAYGFSIFVHDDDFCSFGERREDE